MSTASRRDFLKIAAAGAAGAASFRLGRRDAQAKAITLLHESSFIKTFDEYMQKTLAPAYEKETGVKVVYEITSVGSLPARDSTIIETGSGADISMLALLFPFLYHDKLMDVSDIAEDMGKKQGGWYDVGKEAGMVDGKWKAIPFCNIGQLMNWRTDWFKEVGVTKFPDTWEELYEVGKKLKAKDHPFGFELGHGFGDNHGWLYPLLWSYGGHEVEKDGKTVSIDSSETAAAVDFARKLFKDCCLEDCLELDRRQQQQGVDGRADLVHQQCREHPVVRQARFSRHRQGHRPGAEPAGPERPVPPDELRSATASSTSRREKQAAHDFLRWLMDEKQLGALVRFGRQLLPAGPARLRQRADVAGRAAQHSLSATRWRPRTCPAGRRRRTRQLAESVAKYVVVDMFAKACSGTATKDVIKSAEAQLKEIYRAGLSR